MPRKRKKKKKRDRNIHRKRKRTSNRALYIGSLGTIENQSMSDPLYSPLPAPSQQNAFANEHRQHRRSRVNSTRRLDDNDGDSGGDGAQGRKREKRVTPGCHARTTYRRTRGRTNSFVTVATVELTLSFRAHVEQVDPREKLFR